MTRVPQKGKRNQQDRHWLDWPPHRGRKERIEQLEQLEKSADRLVEEYLRLAPDVEYVPAIRRAAIEAEAMAWMTPVPLLVLPTLLEEKVRQALKVVERQQKIREHSRRIIQSLDGELDSASEVGLHD